jgi:hypothetical protein
MTGNNRYAYAILRDFWNTLEARTSVHRHPVRHIFKDGFGPNEKLLLADFSESTLVGWDSPFSPAGGLLAKTRLTVQRMREHLLCNLAHCLLMNNHEQTGSFTLDLHGMKESPESLQGITSHSCDLLIRLLHAAFRCDYELSEMRHLETLCSSYGNRPLLTLLEGPSALERSTGSLIPLVTPARPSSVMFWNDHIQIGSKRCILEERLMFLQPSILAESATSSMSLDLCLQIAIYPLWNQSKMGESSDRNISPRYASSQDPTSLSSPIEYPLRINSQQIESWYQKSE